MPIEHQPLGPPQPDTRITKYSTSAVRPLDGQKEALLPLHKVPDGMRVFAVQTKPGIATLDGQRRARQLTAATVTSCS